MGLSKLWQSPVIMKLAIDSRQKGTVLIVALFIMVLLEVTVGALMLYHRIEIRHANQYISSQKAMQLAYGGEAWSKAKIYEFYAKDEPLAEAVLPKKEVSGGYVKAQVMDIQGHFNLNTLTNQNVFEGFKSMMRAISPKAGEEVDTIVQLIQKKMLAGAQGGLAEFLPLFSITEIRPLQGMSDVLFNQLLPHVFVLPVVVPLNVNTATEYSLMSLNPNITNDIAKTIVKMRKDARGFKQTEAFLSLPALSGIEVDSERITVLSQFYLSMVTVHYQGVELTLYSLLRVMKVDQDFNVLVYWRSFGTL